MLEESRMDKKSLNRSAQPQSRVQPVDSKKTSDLTHKPWPRSNKKREGPGTAPKNDQSRKNGSSQRGRGPIERRPRARGPSGYSMGGTQGTGVEVEDEPEIGSVFVPGSKKQNLNHLLNFVYPNRLGTERKSHQPPYKRSGQQRAVVHHQHDLYLRAYCQFVVKEDGDYKENLLDPDIPVKWEQIEEIIVRGTGRSECPICLGAPVAGRVGLCGHVYCWPCALHYAATTEKQPPPCPVCTTPLQVKTMKPTRIVQWETPSEEVTMRLVRRLRGSTTVEIAPSSGEMREINKTKDMPLDNVKSAPYTKLFTASKQQVQDIINRERKEIQNQILAEIDTSEIVFMEEALEILKKNEIIKGAELDIPQEPDEVEEVAPTVYEKQVVTEKKYDWFNLTNEGAASSESVEDQIEELAISLDSNLNPAAECFVPDGSNDNLVEEFPLIDHEVTSEQTNSVVDEIPIVTEVDKQNQAKYFYFYQAEDGQQVFLNSLNVRILNASWGALSSAPPVIRGRVLHRETLPLTEQTRKHMPCTAHLPLYCSFDIVEIDLQPPYVTNAALKSFSEELERRARIRARHERDERRRERAYRREMEGPPKPDFSSPFMFPPALSSPVDPPLLSTSVEDHVKASPSTATSSPSAGPSFAKMASTSGTWRVRKVAETQPPPPPEDGESSVPRTINLSDAIEAALQAGAATVSTPAAGKKKKKNNPILLFASGIQREIE